MTDKKKKQPAKKKGGASKQQGTPKKSSKKKAAKKKSATTKKAAAAPAKEPVRRKAAPATPARKSSAKSPTVKKKAAAVLGKVAGKLKAAAAGAARELESPHRAMPPEKAVGGPGATRPAEEKPAPGQAAPRPAEDRPVRAMQPAEIEAATRVPRGSKVQEPAADPFVTEMDYYLFNEGSHLRLWEKLGSHPLQNRGRDATHFAVWAPNARSVSVTGDFNAWNRTSHPLEPRGHSGIWEGVIDGIDKGEIYKYHIVAEDGRHAVDKADPFAVRQEEPPATASVVWDLDYAWRDDEWMASRAARNRLDAPMSVYEVHFGSWRRDPERPNSLLSYREIAPQLVEYVTELGFTHVEFMPLMEHPFYGSWGYQTTGYFAPSSRYGTPQDLMYLIDELHRAGIGVILDWVPSHFPTDEHGLGYFNGTHLFEHEDPRQGFHPDWNSYIFNYGRHEVRSFLLSSALYWIEVFHADGLRVDAVASMLYLDYSRKHGEWIPNVFGGRENIDAIEFLKRFNSDLYQRHPDIQTIAEESTAWPMVSRPTYVGGLGFGLKWDMGWMHDTLQYMSRDPVYRHFHHGEITFRQLYAFTENYTLPLSHDEVVHGKGSLLGKMPGDDWQKFANLRLLFSYMYAQTGKKLLFMGGEIAQWDEWKHDGSLDWHLLQYPPHNGVKKLVADLNRVYRSEPSLHAWDCDSRGFEWISGDDSANSVLTFLRRGGDEEWMAIALNFTPIPRHNYRIGVPRAGWWEEVFNSDAKEYGGSGHGNLGGREATPVNSHGRSHSINLTVPPLGAVFLKWIGNAS